MKGVFHRRDRIAGLSHWLPNYWQTRVGRVRRASAPVRRVWLMFADHFEPWWRQPNDSTARSRTRRWVERWPRIADRHRDSAGRPACYTFFYPEEQYDPWVMGELARLCETGVGDVEVHLHHDRDTAVDFVVRVSAFLQQLHDRHGLLRRDGGHIRFGFIHGNWALDNSLPDGRFCGLDNEITLLRDLGCYADFTLPSAPSPAQTRIVNTIYWATDDPRAPKSHDTGRPLAIGGPVDGDLLMVPGPLTFNVREWTTPSVPRLECGELAGNCLATPHRARLWINAAPRVGGDVFIKLFAHGAPEKNSGPLLEDDGVLDRALRYVAEETARRGAQLYFVSAWQMYQAIDAIRREVNPLTHVASSAVAAEPQPVSAS